MINKKLKLRIAAIVVVSIGLALYGVLTIMPEDRVNQISRLGVSYLDGDYQVTYTGYSGDKTWIVRNSKVTSEPAKGYYFFWAHDSKTNKKRYVQVPMANTYIEEIND
tara:strand:- start:546 stop:869 length:324 start_codon:yes stop_codon:yes gene_type:complete